jgi:signal transduction histidine kinase
MGETGTFLDVWTGASRLRFSPSWREARMAAQPDPVALARLLASAGRRADASAGDDEVKRELARELHDQVVQELTAMLIDLENFKTTAFDRQSTVKQVDSVQGSLRTMLGRMRNLLYGLRDEEALEPDFADTLRVFAVQYTGRTGVRVLVRVGRDWPDPIRRTAAQHLSRIIHESVNNARQHGGARSVRVSLRMTEPTLARVTIQDDGRGVPDHNGLAKPGMGILGMRERALLLGGSLTVDGAPGGGAIIRATFPRAALVPE